MAFAEKIERLLSDDALRARMSVAAYAYSKQFTPAAIATEWEGIYTDALSRN